MVQNGPLYPYQWGMANSIRLERPLNKTLLLFCFKDWSNFLKVFMILSIIFWWSTCLRSTNFEKTFQGLGGYYSWILSELSASSVFGLVSQFSWLGVAFFHCLFFCLSIYFILHFKSIFSSSFRLSLLFLCLSLSISVFFTLFLCFLTFSFSSLVCQRGISLVSSLCQALQHFSEIFYQLIWIQGQNRMATMLNCIQRGTVLY